MGNYNRDNRSGSRGGFGGGDYRGGNSRGGNSRGGGRREMHDAVCDKCGKDCQVPFRPTSGKPVYCSECFEKTDNRGGSSSSGNYQDRGQRGRPSYEKRDRPGPQNSAQLDAIGKKLDKIIELLSSKPLPEIEVVVEHPAEKTVEKKERKEKKEKKADKKTAKKKKSSKKKASAKKS